MDVFEQEQQRIFFQSLNIHLFVVCCDPQHWNRTTDRNVVLYLPSGGISHYVTYRMERLPNIRTFNVDLGIREKLPGEDEPAMASRATSLQCWSLT
jgi:hypothetical protein